MTERDLASVDHSLTGIKVAVAQLQERVDNHLDHVQETLSAAFAEHELREMEAQQKLLMTTIKTVVGWFAALLAGIGGALWWAFTVFIDRLPWP